MYRVLENIDNFNKKISFVSIWSFVKGLLKYIGNLKSICSNNEVYIFCLETTKPQRNLSFVFINSLNKG